MNCKQGDLALIVKSKAGNEGKIVRCICFIGSVHGWNGSDRWEIDIEINGTRGYCSNHVPDYQLRPIRDPGDDAQDETLSWLPVPSKTLEQA